MQISNSTQIPDGHEHYGHVTSLWYGDLEVGGKDQSNPQNV